MGRQTQPVHKQYRVDRDARHGNWDREGADAARWEKRQMLAQKQNRLNGQRTRHKGT